MAVVASRAMEWELERSEVVLRRRPLRALTLPWRERRFLYEEYEAFLRRLADPRFLVVPLRELASTEPGDRIVIGLRHDVDERLDNAVRLARLEQRHGVRSSWFVLHTAGYYGVTRRGEARHDPAILASLAELQRLGHEVGFHHDLVTLQCVYGVPPVDYLAGELAWLRENGIDVVGCAAHGSYWCHALGFNNNYAFAGLDEPIPGFPNVEVVDGPLGSCRIEKTTLGEHGLRYEANHLPLDAYNSDSYHDAAGNRWHPSDLDLDALAPGERAVVLLHPCHWDPGAAAKWKRSLAWNLRRARQVALQRTQS